jgi:hypothetical protein
MRGERVTDLVLLPTTSSFVYRVAEHWVPVTLSRLIESKPITGEGG